MPVAGVTDHVYDGAVLCPCDHVGTAVSSSSGRGHDLGTWTTSATVGCAESSRFVLPPTRRSCPACAIASGHFVEDAGGGSDLAADLELVVSELATNVIEHTRSPTLTVSISAHGDDWLVEVSDVADLGILDDVALPDQTQASGRGLFVVESIVDDIAIVEIGDSYAIRCRIGVG